MNKNYDMDNKNKAFARKSRFFAGGLFVLVVAGFFFLSTDKGRNLFSNRVNYYSSKANLGKFREVKNPIKDQYIVVLKDNADSDAEAVRLAGKYNSHAKNVYHYALKGFSAKLTESQAKVISEDDAVDHVEEDSTIEAQTIQTNVPWDLGRVDNHNGFIAPLDTNYEYTNTGSGVNTYIIDTGIITANSEFEGRASQPFDAQHDWDPSDAALCNIHGTGVAGVVGSASYGVAKQAKLYSIKVFPCQGLGSMSDIINGVDYVTQRAVKPAVANMSLAGGYSSTFNQAVQSMINKGIVVVVAAGNYGEDACTYSPASLPGAITVTGNDDRDYANGFNSGTTSYTGMNYGTCVDLYAPGVNLTTVYGRNGQPSGGFSGTSFASPMVAGAAALYLQSHPTASPAEVQSAVISNATSNVILGDLKGTPNRLLFSNLGAGTPPTSGSDTTPPTVTISSPRNGSTIRNKDAKVSVSASDTSGISSIVISLDGAIIKTCYDLTTCNATLAASSMSPGSHTLSASAADRTTTHNTTSTSISITKN